MKFTVRDTLNPACSLVCVDGVWAWSRSHRPATFTSTRLALRTLAGIQAKQGWVPTMVDLVPDGFRTVVFDAAMAKAAMIAPAPMDQSEAVITRGADGAVVKVEYPNAPDERRVSRPLNPIVGQSDSEGGRE